MRKIARTSIADFKAKARDESWCEVKGRFRQKQITTSTADEYRNCGGKSNIKPEGISEIITAMGKMVDALCNLTPGE